MLKLFEYQKVAVNQLKTGSILCGGVGSGKSLTALYYYFTKECGGEISDNDISDMKDPKDLFIITPAKKRDSLDWERECAMFPLSRDRSASINGAKVIVDSWNNIKKYENIKHAFFIFDEQRLVGSGSWVKSFLKISKNNKWILLSATPGDTWMDYIPTFIANGFYKNRTEFIRKHVVYNTFVKYPKVDRYIEEGKLIRLRNSILVKMFYSKPTKSYYIQYDVSYDKNKFDLVLTKRWNPFKNKPIKDISEFCYTMRKVVNSDPSRLEAIRKLIEKHHRIIVFYNFDYELEILRKLNSEFGIKISEYNGHKHEAIPNGETWIYLVQYMSGGEAWNCIETNAMIFYSRSYSYRMTIQAAGRIDRLNTPFTKLYYYTLVSSSLIDDGIGDALSHKKDFNEKSFKI